jgi:hypothetical protein
VGELVGLKDDAGGEAADVVGRDEGDAHVPQQGDGEAVRAPGTVHLDLDG